MIVKCAGCGCLTDAIDRTCNLCRHAGCAGCIHDDGLHDQCLDILRQRDDLPPIGVGL